MVKGIGVMPEYGVRHTCFFCGAESVQWAGPNKNGYPECPSVYAAPKGWKRGLGRRNHVYACPGCVYFVDEHEKAMKEWQDDRYKVAGPLYKSAHDAIEEWEKKNPAPLPGWEEGAEAAEQERAAAKKEKEP